MHEETSCVNGKKIQINLIHNITYKKQEEYIRYVNNSDIKKTCIQINKPSRGQRNVFKWNTVGFYQT